MEKTIDQIIFSLINMEQRSGFAAFVVMLLVIEELRCKCLISVKETQQTVPRIKNKLYFLLREREKCSV